MSAALTALLLPVLPGSAQEPKADEPRPPRPAFDAGPARENGEAPERRGPRPGGLFRGGDRQRPEGFKPDFDRYLKILEERDPAEAERLAALKKSGDKEAFNQAIRKHFESRMGGQRMGKGYGGSGGMSMGKGMFRKPNPKLEEIRGRLRTALEAYHANPSDEAKAALRTVIAEEFDEGCVDHQRHIDQMEEVLGKMKSAIAEQRSRRDAHIENRLKRALELRLPRGPGPGKGPGPDEPRTK